MAKKMNKQNIFVTSILLGLILGSILILPSLTLAQGPPPRPTPGSPAGNGASNSASDDHNGDKGIINGDITGAITDLSTGLPGAGVIVQINNIPIKSDAAGLFSLTDIADGIYQVSLSLPAEYTPAQPVQAVIIANRNKVDLTLGYYSMPQPVEAAPKVDSLPRELPHAGGISFWAHLRRGDVIGIMFIFSALMFHFSKISRPDNRNTTSPTEF